MFTRADDTDKIIGGVVGGVVGFLVVIVLPVIVFFYIRKRKQGGFKGSDGKVQPHDEEGGLDEGKGSGRDQQGRMWSAA
eukprot:1137975-Pelagomonas_calceolata.AAC.2